MIVAHEVTKQYGKVKVVDQLSFEVKQGEVFALIGTNGAGKTTTIMMMLKLTQLTDGRIEIKEGVKIGYSPDSPHLHPFLSGEETLRFYAKLDKIDKKVREERIESALQIVGLTSKRQIKVSKYSKGMLQRISVAQALLGDPDLLILDEPCAGLDPIGRIEMLKLIHTLKEQGKTIIITSHILNDIERIADRVMMIHLGKKVKEIELHQLIETDKDKDLETLFVSEINLINEGGR